MANTKTTAKPARSNELSKKESSKPKENKSTVVEFEIDFSIWAIPMAMIISSLLISLPLSLAIYLGLRDNGLGGGSGNQVLAAECDPASPYTKGCLVAQAEEIGMDTNRFQSCLDSKQFDNLVQSNLDLGNEIGVQGTPSLYIGQKEGNTGKIFEIGPSVTEVQISDLIDRINSGGIQTAANYWKDQQLTGLSAYETQLRDFYTQQGITGEALENNVNTGLSQQKSTIEAGASIKEVDLEIANIKGSGDNDVILVEFSDYECPYCKQFALGNGKTINDNLVEKGEIDFAHYDFPLESIHPNARNLANAARCAQDQGKYFEMHDSIFEVE